MKWEYKRVLFPGDIGPELPNAKGEKRRSAMYGKRIVSEGLDPVEKFLNELGEDGWELVSTSIVDGPQSSHYYTERCIVEYVLKRAKS